MAHDARHSRTSVPDCVSSAAVARTVVSLPDYPRPPRPATRRRRRSERRPRRGSRAPACRPSSIRRRSVASVGAAASARTMRGSSARRVPRPGTKPGQPRARHAKAAGDRADHRADVDAGAARADRHLRGPQMKRPLRQLMADQAADRRRRATISAARRSATHAARLASHGATTQQRRPRDRRGDERRAQAAVTARPVVIAREWYTLGHDLPVPPAPRRRRARLRHAADDRARADAHLLGRHVLPLRVSGDFDRALRRQRQRRLRVRVRRAARSPRHRRSAVAAVAALRGVHDRRAVLCWSACASA